MLAEIIDIWDVVYPICQSFYYLFILMAKIFLDPRVLPVTIFIIAKIFLKRRRL